MTSPTTSLPQAVLLMAFDPHTGKPRHHVSSARIIQAAAVGELVVSRRVTVAGNKVELRDETPTGDRVADAVLADVARSGPLLFRNILTAEDFAMKAGTRPEQIVREDLEALGLVTTEKGGLLRRTRVVATGSSPANELTEQISLAVAEGAGVNARLAALISVLDVYGLLSKVVGEKLSPSERATVDRIVSGSDFGVGLRRAVAELDVP